MIRGNHSATDTSHDATVASRRQSSPSGTEHAKREANSAVDDAKRMAAQKQEELQQLASEAADMAKAKAYETAERAKESGRQYAYEKKARAAEEIGVFSGAIRKAADKLHEEEHSSIASYVECAAEQLDQLRDSLESKRVSEIVDDVQDFARRRPEVVYGGLFVAGLAAMRFLKASKPSRRFDRNADQRDLSDDSQRPAAAFGHAPRQQRQHQPLPPLPTPAGFGQGQASNGIGGT